MLKMKNICCLVW